MQSFDANRQNNELDLKIVHYKASHGGFAEKETKTKKQGFVPSNAPYSHIYGLLVVLGVRSAP